MVVGKLATLEDQTFFAPGQRDSADLISLEASSASSAHIGQEILNAIPDLAMILNDKRQIVAANQHCLDALGLEFAESLHGQRLGEALRCIHAGQGPNGCGTSVACRQCGATKAMMSCLNSQGSAQYECRITAHEVESDFETSMEFLAKANYVKIGDYGMVLLVLRDISAEKRKDALERLFFHDVLNTVGGMIGLADLMVTVNAAQSNDYAHLIHHLAENVAEEITAHRNLIQAENGTLQVDLANVCVGDIFEEVAEGLRYHPICKGLQIETQAPENCCLRTDRVLLRRIVGNLTKNALEASPKGSTIKLEANSTAEGVKVQVRNPGVIPESIQSQLFKRSFSTKGDVGRGLGTYSIKRFAERFLHGRISFTSGAEDGTVFMVDLPSIIETTSLRV